MYVYVCVWVCIYVTMYMYIICIKCVLRQFVKVTAPFDVSGVALVQLLRSLLLLRSHLFFFAIFIPLMAHMFVCKWKGNYVLLYCNFYCCHMMMMMMHSMERIFKHVCASALERVAPQGLGARVIYIFASLLCEKWLWQWERRTDTHMYVGVCK